MTSLSVLTQAAQFPQAANTPEIEIGDTKYVVRFARTVEELDAALKLRFEVFNLELDEGLNSSLQTGRDRDEFDATCHHLIAMEKTSGKVVGTYRLRTMEMAGSAAKFYSSAEFELNQLGPAVLNQSVELGRACIARDHRHRQVLFLLWRALALYVTKRRKRFLFGCCSLTSQDPSEGNQLFDQLRMNDQIHPVAFVSVMPGYECSGNDSENTWPIEVKLPRLFDTYLGIGAKVCSPPAIDRRFRTIDFLVIFDVQGMGSKLRRLFFSV